MLLLYVTVFVGGKIKSMLWVSVCRSVNFYHQSKLIIINEQHCCPQEGLCLIHRVSWKESADQIICIHLFPFLKHKHFLTHVSLEHVNGQFNRFNLSVSLFLAFFLQFDTS